MAAHASFFVVLFITLVSLFSSASSQSLLLPLYIYPGTNLTNWQPMFSAISAYPKVFFTVIVNPNSGPGPNGSYPDSNYIAGLSKLNTYSNTLLLGYVHVSYATRPIASVKADIATYANWTTYPSSSDISVTGIFFDEAPSDNSSASVQYMASVAAYARSKIQDCYIVYNPGTVTSNAYFSPTPPDLIVQFENLPSQWAGSKTVATFPKPVSRSAVVVHNSTSTSQAQNITKQCVSLGVGAVYATPDCCYQNLSFVAPVAAALNT